MEKTIQINGVKVTVIRPELSDKERRARESVVLHALKVFGKEMRHEKF